MAGQELGRDRDSGKERDRDSEKERDRNPEKRGQDFQG